MRRELTRKDLQDLERHLAKGHEAEYETYGTSREEEDNYFSSKNVFDEIRGLGHTHIDTIRVVPSDGREPYIIIDTEKKEASDKRT